MVALVGRPNVGKSALFNRLVGARRAIVDNAPGVTRDRLVAVATCGERRFLCVDTGGFLAEAPVDPKAMGALVRGQALAAIDEADVICVLDAAAGFLPVDRDDGAALAARASPSCARSTRSMGRSARTSCARLLVGRRGRTLFPTSAAHGRGIGELREAIVAALPPSRGDTTTAARASASRLRRATERRQVLAPEPPAGPGADDRHAEAGTTRDAIDTAVTVDGDPGS